MSDQTHQRLQSVLKWSLRMQTDDNETSQPTEMTQERRQWLKDCLETLSSQPSETDFLKAALAVLKTQYDNQSGDAGNKLLDAFEQLQYLVENLDHAKDLIPLDGVGTIIKYLHHQNSDLQVCACDVIAAATQNLPKCQIAFIPSMDQLLHLLGDDNTCDSLKGKAIYALSGIVRGNAVSVNQLEKRQGISTLLHCLSSTENNRKLIVKVCFLLLSLYHEPDDVLRAEGERVMATLLQRLLERDDDDELKGLHCTTIRRVTSVTDDSKLLKERAHKLKPILNELKDKVDEEDGTKDAVKELIVLLEP